MPTSIAQVWPRIVAHAGEPFKTITGLEFTYEVPGNFITPSRTKRHLSRSNFAEALDYVPLTSTAEIQHLQGPSYTFAILMDVRISQGDW